MVLGALYGVTMGVVGGVVAGNYLFAGKQPRKFPSLDIAADFDDTIPDPETGGKPTDDTAALEAFLKLSPPWTKWPDYQRVTWMNIVVATLWPQLSEAIKKQILDAATPEIEKVVQQVSVLQSIEIEELSLGKVPVRLGALKVYDTVDDEVIIEAPVSWGSAMAIRVSAKLKLGPYVFYIPVEVSDLQLTATARITLKPLVETLPCLGTACVTLLDEPHVDLKACLINSLDLMALPGIKEAARYAVKTVLGKLIMYPYSMSFDIMPDGGRVPPPKGMLVVRVLRAEGIKSPELIKLSKADPFAELSVREGRIQRTHTEPNNLNPEWNEDFEFVVDDYDVQQLHLRVRDDDMGFSDRTIGEATVSFQNAAFIEQPFKSHRVEVEIFEPAAKGKGRKALGRGLTRMTTAVARRGGGTKATKQQLSRGKVFLEIKYLLFKSTGSAAAKETKEAAGPSAPSTEIAAKKVVNPGQPQKTAVPPAIANLKGLLTVTLIRCKNLEAHGENTVDSYVLMSLYDENRAKPLQERSSVVMNEDSPRWGSKHDFPWISATSMLTLSVYHKVGMVDSLISLKTLKGHRDDKKIGSLRLSVAEVVRNRRMKDIWPLQGTQQGEIELALEWLPVILEDH